MNKKGQMQGPYPGPEQGSPFGGAHPVLLLGIIIFVIPFFNYVLGWNLPGWFSGIGIILILAGAGLSIWSSSNL